MAIDSIDKAVKATLDDRVPKVSINHLTQCVTVNGVDFSFAMLVQMSNPDSERLLRFHRDQNMVLVKAYDLRLLRAIVDDFPKIEVKQVQLATAVPKVQL